MEATFQKPPLKNPTTALPARRGRVKAQIFEGVADSIVFAASKALGLMMIKKDDTQIDDSAPATPPVTPNNTSG